MDSNLMQLAVCGGLTLLLLVLVLVLWRYAKLRTSLWWLGFALLPIAAYLIGIVPALVDFWNALVTWWNAVSPGMPTTLVAGLAVGGLGVVLMLVSRVVPYRSKKADSTKPARKKAEQEPDVVEPESLFGTRPVYDAAPVAQPGPVSQATPPGPTAS